MEAGFTAALPFGMTSLPMARRMVGRLMLDQRCPLVLVQDGRLVAHELLANGLLHGAPDDLESIELACRVTVDHVWISVHDGGRDGTVEVRPPSQDRADGRGLALVDALSEAWQVDRTHGTRVSAWLPR